MGVSENFQIINLITLIPYSEDYDGNFVKIRLEDIVAEQNEEEVERHNKLEPKEN